MSLAKALSHSRQQLSWLKPSAGKEVGLHVVACHEYTSSINNKILCSIILKIGAMQALSLYRYHKLMASVYIIMYRAYSLMDI